MSSVFETGKTIGLELEAPDIRDFCNLNGFQRAHDASIITPAKGINKIVWEKIPRNLNGFEMYSLGTELVSTNPISIDENLESFLKSKLSNLFSYGQREESSLTDRAGVHVHITAPVNLRLFKEILSLGCHLEDVFFLLGGFGKTYRGINNDSIYARPITKFGPPIINTNNGYAKVFEIEDLLNSKSINEFIYRYGNSDRFRDRYVPVRYTWLNLLPIIRQGSLEFRVFNITQNPIYLSAVIILIQWFLERCLEKNYNNTKFLRLKENSVYDYRDKEDIITTLINIVEGEISDKHLKILIDIMERTPVESIRFRKSHIYSHLMIHPTRGNSTGTFWQKNDLYSYKPTILSSDNILPPDFMDSHQAKNFTTIQRKNFFTNIKPKNVPISTEKEKENALHDYLINGGILEESLELLSTELDEVRDNRRGRFQTMEPSSSPSEEQATTSTSASNSSRSVRDYYRNSWMLGPDSITNNNSENTEDE